MSFLKAYFVKESNAYLQESISYFKESLIDKNALYEEVSPLYKKLSNLDKTHLIYNTLAGVVAIVSFDVLNAMDVEVDAFEYMLTGVSHFVYAGAILAKAVEERSLVTKALETTAITIDMMRWTGFMSDQSTIPTPVKIFSLVTTTPLKILEEMIAR